MVHTKYKFTPQDIAVYLLFADLSRPREEEILSNLFQEHNDEIVWGYRQDFLKLRFEVRDAMALYELNDDEYAETQLILKEFDISRSDTEPDYFGAYFKLIKLKLLYSGKDFHRIKLRTLLRDFGYKRRTTTLINSMERAMKALDLRSYLKRYEPCELSQIDLDQMIMIRLSSQK